MVNPEDTSRPEEIEQVDEQLPSDGGGAEQVLDEQIAVDALMGVEDESSPVSEEQKIRPIISVSGLIGFARKQGLSLSVCMGSVQSLPSGTDERDDSLIVFGVALAAHNSAYTISDLKDLYNSRLGESDGGYSSVKDQDGISALLSALDNAHKGYPYVEQLLKNAAKRKLHNDKAAVLRHQQHQAALAELENSAVALRKDYLRDVDSFGDMLGQVFPDRRGDVRILTGRVERLAEVPSWQASPVSLLKKEKEHLAALEGFLVDIRDMRAGVDTGREELRQAEVAFEAVKPELESYRYTQTPAYRASLERGLSDAAASIRRYSTSKTGFITEEHRKDYRDAFFKLEKLNEGIPVPVAVADAQNGLNAAKNGLENSERELKRLEDEYVAGIEYAELYDAFKRLIEQLNSEASKDYVGDFEDMKNTTTGSFIQRNKSLLLAVFHADTYVDKNTIMRKFIKKHEHWGEGRKVA